jgi:hypothetical protein
MAVVCYATSRGHRPVIPPLLEQQLMECSNQVFQPIIGRLPGMSLLAGLRYDPRQLGALPGHLSPRIPRVTLAASIPLRPGSPVELL